MSCDPGKYEEKVDGALERMPFDAAHSLLLLGYREAWRAALVRAEKARDGRKPLELEGGFEAALTAHKKGAKDAREAWASLGLQWAKGPRGEKEGAEVVKAIGDMAKSAAMHCIAARVRLEAMAKGKKGAEKQRAETEEHYKSFEAARSALKQLRGVVAPTLRESVTMVLWACGWHGANAVGDMLDEMEMEEMMAEDEEDCEDEGDEEEEADEEEEEDDLDLDALFGEEYPGASDDCIEDLKGALDAFRECFWESKPWRGVSLDISPLDGAGASAELEAIAAVPGLFGDRGLNAVRLVLNSSTTEGDLLGETGREALLKADALELEVVLEVSIEGGKQQQARLKAMASAAARCRCVRGVALPRLAGCQGDAAGLVRALRDGGLSPDRCAVIVAAPGGVAADAEDDWTSDFRQLHEAGASGGLPPLLFDGNVLLEAPPRYAPVEDGGPADMQSLLDAACCEQQFPYLNVATGLSLVLPAQATGSGKKAAKPKPGSKDKAAPEAADPPDSWFAEYAQRLVAASGLGTHGFFFDSWQMPEGTEVAAAGLKGYLSRGWVDFSADCRVMQPVGAHKTTLVYLHGFMCTADDYLVEPHMFYRPKPQKKGKDKGKKKDGKKSGGDEDDDEIEYEPWPGLKVVLPTAPVRKITAHGGDENPAWYDYITDYEGEAEDELCEDSLEEQCRRIHHLLDAEVALVGAKNVFLGGASQGCCAALHAGLTYNGDLGAIVATMGHLLKCTPVGAEWVARKIPIYNYIGDSDTTFPWEEWTKATWQRLEEAGGDVHHHLEPGADHGECEDKWVPAFLKERLTPSSVKKTGAAAKKVTKKK